MTKKGQNKTSKRSKGSNIIPWLIKNKLLLLGIILIILAFVLLLGIFFPAINKEIKYFFLDKNQNIEISLGTTSNNDKKTTTTEQQKQVKKKIIPADNNFSVIIPKIGVNVKVEANVDPFNQGEYRNKLEKAIAHAKNSGLPDDKKTTFLFAHSSNNFYEDGDYNTIFYLLHKLKDGDIFYVVYKNHIYKYKINKSKIVQAKETKYLQDNSNNSAIILMTCWPPGTSNKRLLIFGELVSVSK